MCTTIKSFDQLNSAFKSADRADISLIEVLADPNSCDVKRKKAAKELTTKVSIIMKKVNDRFYVMSSKDNETYQEYCCMLAAYILLDKNRKNIKEAMLTLEALLEFLSNKSKRELRTVKRGIKVEGAKIDSLGFTWADIKFPFQPETFAMKYAMTKITEPVHLEPKVDIQIQTVTIEKEVTKYVAVPAEDLDYFGPENHYTEHKASFLFPPKDQKIQDQPKEVCRKICGMLNADGGKIYIGVDNNTWRTLDSDGILGAHGDIKHVGYNRHGDIVATIEQYAHYIYEEICIRFKRSNAMQSNLFISECISVNIADNGNVICINVKPSDYCTVYLDDIAYIRTADECRAMNDQEIIRRNETRRHIGKEARIEFEIRKAIRDNKQVIIRRYRSSNSNEISDRRVEPYALVCNNESVMCYDLDKQAVRQFKMSRMEDVTVLDCECKHICEHNEKRTDVFEWTYTGKCYHIMLSMSLKAMSHLCERHKGAKQYFCRCSDNEWVLDAHVYSLEPITGFYLSMAKEVSIIETEDYEVFRSHVSEYVDKYLLNCA